MNILIVLIFLVGAALELSATFGLWDWSEPSFSPSPEKRTTLVHYIALAIMVLAFAGVYFNAFW